MSPNLSKWLKDFYAEQRAKLPGWVGGTKLPTVSEQMWIFLAALAAGFIAGAMTGR